MLLDVDAIVFDLDGTLVDSVPDLTLAVSAMMQDLSLHQPTQADLRRWVGNGAPMLVKRALTGQMDGEPDPALFERAQALFDIHYSKFICVESRLYDGVLAGLRLLRSAGMPLACVTNKPQRFTEPLLKRLAIDEYFSVILGGDATARRKPAPDPLLLAAKRLGVAPDRLLMVGDSVNDVGAARKAGCPIICVPYGYNHGEDIADARPDAVVDSIEGVYSLLNRDDS